MNNLLKIMCAGVMLSGMANEAQGANREPGTVKNTVQTDWTNVKATDKNKFKASKQADAQANVNIAKTNAAMIDSYYLDEQD